MLTSWAIHSFQEIKNKNKRTSDKMIASNNHKCQLLILWLDVPIFSLCKNLLFTNLTLQVANYWRFFEQTLLFWNSMSRQNFMKHYSAIIPSNSFEWDKDPIIFLSWNNFILMSRNVLIPWFWLIVSWNQFSNN
jgi:hypothetical protein